MLRAVGGTWWPHYRECFTNLPAPLSPLSSLFFKRCVAARTVVSGADCDEFLDGGMFPVMATALYGAAVTLSGKKVN